MEFYRSRCMRSDARFWLSSWPMWMVVLAAMTIHFSQLFLRIADGAYSWLPKAFILGALAVVMFDFAIRFLRSRRECTRQLQQLQFAGGRLQVDGYSKVLEAGILELMATQPQVLREFRTTVFPLVSHFVWPLVAVLFLLPSDKEGVAPGWTAGMLAGIGACLLVWMLSARVRVLMKEGRQHLTPGDLPWMHSTSIDLKNCTVHAREQVGWIDIKSGDTMVRLATDHASRPRTCFYSLVAAIALEMEEVPAASKVAEASL